MIRVNVNYWRLSSLAFRCIPRHETFILFVLKRVYLVLNKAELVWSFCITRKTNSRITTMNINLLVKMIVLFSDLDEWISQSKYCITDNAIHQECSRFSKKLCCRLQNVLFYFMMLLKRIIITFKIRNSHAKTTILFAFKT